MEEKYGVVECTLDERFDPWRLLVCAILAAQCTDARVNLVSPALFARFKTIEDFASSNAKAIEPYIASCGLFRNKAKAIYAASVYIMTEHQGQVPKEMDELLKIPGVGRKIANLIRGECFNIPGLVVDTHCGRLARRLGFSTSENAKVIEGDLCPLVNPQKWREWGLYMVTHGREICKSQNPQCANCFIIKYCDYGQKEYKNGK